MWSWVFLFAASILVAAVQAKSLVMDIEWVLQGNTIGFTGFFCELLGMSSGLLSWFPEMRVGKGSYIESSNEPHFGGKNPTKNKIKSLFEIDLLPKESSALMSLSFPSQPRSTLKANFSEYAMSLGMLQNEYLLQSNFSNCLNTSLVEFDTAYKLGDLSKRFAPYAYQSAEACCTACAMHPLCVAWTHGPEFVGEFASSIGPAGERLNKCSFKGSLPPHRENELTESEKGRVLARNLPNGMSRVAGRPGFTSGVLPTKKIAPRAIIFHGTMCIYRNESVHTYSRDANTIYIGRYMVERPRFPGGFSQDEYVVFSCAARMDEVWVPTEWHRDVFIATMHSMGIPSNGRIAVIPEAVDTELFDPAQVRTREQGNPFLVRRRDSVSGCRLLETVTCPDIEGVSEKNKFRFLSVFKWERRKGWDVLLSAYWRAFSSQDDVVLILRTYVPSFTAHMGINITQHIEEYALEHFKMSSTELAPVVWEAGDVDRRGDSLTRAEIRDLLASVDCFVLPTRGEGWGLPIAEAMSMQLPVIVTNCSGPLAYASDDNAYLVPVLPQLDEMAYVQPNITALTGLMRQVIHDAGPDGQNRAQQKSIRARARMQELNPTYVAGLMADRLKAEAQLRGWRF